MNMKKKNHENILLYFKKKMKKVIDHIRYDFMLKKISSSDHGKKIYIMNVPEHGNLGDQAITKAELEYLNKYFSSSDIIEIPSKMISYKLKELKEVIKKNDILFLHGGGYLGTIWPEEEEIARVVIKNFFNNKIIVLPQTMYYEESNFGKAYLESSKIIYNNHPDLHLCAREEKTYEAFKENFPNTHAVQVPDIVLYLNESKEQWIRQGMLVCFRNDKEAVKSNDVEMKLKLVSRKMNLKITYTDTVIDKIVTKKNRNKELEKKFEEFKKSKVVVTDRLHGMIFSVVTGTPCVALNNKSGKVKGVYQWVKHLDYIKFVEEIEDLEIAIKEVYTSGNVTYNNIDLIKNYQPLEKIFWSNDMKFND